MNNKRNRTTWGISLLIVGISTIIISFSSIIRIKLPDILKRGLGVILILALPVLIYSYVKILKDSKS
ncbi:hypothetical protein IRP63_06895 [Clostridium botulinum]|uniref:Uncharacterized protein n=1 Tax=Clostridium botulinum C/D str. DC5 TaxID=1443128 RepID=A0A0A0ICB4_CLOBO|nr:hypothetical protein [Clostridium botulinum]KEI04422.1 hypothetical protein Z952_07065 [Clostridium botulinum C/D str. BKT75002]KEI11331.1 hypothetical protein Z954_08545 [Clostridium botulinum C/D str. BKT2873]KGM97195.1 hypothetical protein Z955_12435 [Clostridium botulinum C/D str. DC5]KOC55343.1 hypothetical protein ADU89_05675 [Clostridium botulinum]KOC56786.1 hypothetical protein ADU90_07245 [Clostridium botulinum]